MVLPYLLFCKVLRQISKKRIDHRPTQPTPNDIIRLEARKMNKPEIDTLVVPYLTSPYLSGDLPFTPGYVCDVIGATDCCIPLPDLDTVIIPQMRCFAPGKLDKATIKDERAFLE